jgi:hypothetical protein
MQMATKLASRLAVLAMFAALVWGCPAAPPLLSPNDMGVMAPPDGPTVVGAYSDCTPAGWSDVVCQSNLRCGLVQVGDPPYQGSESECVPMPQNPLKLNDPCQFDQGGMSPVDGVNRYYDSCGPGLGCVQTETMGWRCRTLCSSGLRAGCGKELCVLPTQVEGTGYCVAQDGCQPVFPQSGCGTDPQGNPLGCYVLTDDTGGGSFCLRFQSYGSSTGAINSLCGRSVNCQAGLACNALPSHDPDCRPYCSLPVVPDGGTPPDMAGGVNCANDLGTCNPIYGYGQYGFCY